MSIERWREADGDNTMALDWPLTEDSHVWEIGGFEGRWAQQIWDKYHCHITIFEPQDWAVQKMRERFKGIDKIKIRSYGLWTENTELLIGNFHTDGASVINDDGREPKVLGVFKSYQTEMSHVDNIDLALMNIEGAEYTLLPEFIRSGHIGFFKNLFVQFHPHNENVSYPTHKIFSDMEQTHDLLWDFFPTAVAWKLNAITEEIYEFYS